MFEWTANYLGAEGYRHYEVSNFARPGFESRHNLIYWNNQEYLGMGPGAFSYLEGVRFQFASDVDSYIKKCNEEDWVPASAEIITEEKEVGLH